MKNTLLAALMFLSLSCQSGILISGVSTPYTSLEFNNDPQTNVGPDWTYLWVPDGVYAEPGELVYGVIGPGWYSASYDAEWNLLTQNWTPGYSVTIIDKIPLVYLFIFPNWYGNAIDFTGFLSLWEGFGGTYIPPIPLAVSPHQKQHGKGRGK